MSSFKFTMLRGGVRTGELRLALNIRVWAHLEKPLLSLFLRDWVGGFIYLLSYCVSTV